MTCKTCGGRGVYRDLQCRAESCAHADRVPIQRNEEGKVTKTRAHMPCPDRACSCPAVAEARAAQAKRVAEQEGRFVALDRVTRDVRREEVWA